MMKRALITGITGQDGSYMAELLLEKGYSVYGLVRENTSTEFIDPIKDELTLITGDMRDQDSLNKATKLSMPDEVYHFASESFVPVSWKQPILTGDVNALGTTRLLEAVKTIKPDTRVYHASTSEMFGLASEIKTEESLFHPRSPYAISKCFSHWISVNYRESYNMFVCCGILFNHESPRRGQNFVTKKISKSVVEIKAGVLDCLYLGNIDSRRDWGYAEDYVEAIWLMLQQAEPDDYIVSTGKTHSVREFLEEAFNVVDVEIESNGKNGPGEQYIRKDNGRTVVRISEDLYRPVELITLQGSNSKAKEKLGWEPKVKFEDLVRIMVEYEQSLLE